MLRTFGEVALLVDHVTVPLQVLLPEVIIQLVPETEPVTGRGGGSAQLLPFQEVPPTQLAVRVVVLSTVLLSLTETVFAP